MISYAQNHEDVVLARTFDAPSGFYIDVGAASPVIHSVTNHFYQLGWHGINIEPLEMWYEQLVKERPRDINIRIGLGDAAGEREFFDVSSSASEESTFSLEVADALRARGLEPDVRRIMMTTLAAVCEEHAEQRIDFLKIDVEGTELEVLRGGDWDRFRPIAIVVESTRPGTSESVGNDIAKFLKEVKYSQVLFDGLNSFFVRDEDKRLRKTLSTPANVTDRFEVAELVGLRESLQAVERAVVEARTEADSERQEAERRLSALEAVRSDFERAREHATDLEGRLDSARNDVAAARREASDAQIQFRASREALECALSESASR